MPTQPILANATNMFGPLKADMKDKIRAYLDAPSVEGWDEIHCIIVNGHGFRTIWQAVLEVDPTFPRTGNPEPKGKKITPAMRWSKFPDALTVARAIRKATQPVMGGNVGGRHGG